MRALFVATLATLLLVGCASSGIVKGEFSKATLYKNLAAAASGGRLSSFAALPYSGRIG